jgi:GAF domain-containing protein
MAIGSHMLSLERKLRMYESREAIVSRIGSETFSVINLDHFLQATVTEVGKMMEVDRCDVIALAPAELRVTHEYLSEAAGVELPSALGLRLSIDLDRLQEDVDLYSPLVVNDTADTRFPSVINTLFERLSSKSALIVPITFNLQLLGMIGLHHCRDTRAWLEDEVNFLRNLAEQIAIGYRYTHI